MSLATADLPEELEAPRAFAVTCQGALKMAEAAIQFAGQQVVQTAFVWDPIERLLAASPQAS